MSNVLYIAGLVGKVEALQATIDKMTDQTAQQRDELRRAVRERNHSASALAARNAEAAALVQSYRRAHTGLRVANLRLMDRYEAAHETAVELGKELDRSRTENGLALVDARRARDAALSQRDTARAARDRALAEVRRQRDEIYELRRQRALAAAQRFDAWNGRDWPPETSDPGRTHYRWENPKVNYRLFTGNERPPAADFALRDGITDKTWAENCAAADALEAAAADASRRLKGE